MEHENFVKFESSKEDALAALSLLCKNLDDKLGPEEFLMDQNIEVTDNPLDALIKLCDLMKYEVEITVKY
jgi:hypothetical protein